MTHLGSRYAVRARCSFSAHGYGTDCVVYSDNATIANIANRESTPPLVTDFARCVRGNLERAVPEVPNTTPEFIAIQFICGTRFRITNKNPMWVDVTWRVK